MNVVPEAKLQFLDDNGDPLVGGKVFSYIPGTTVSKNTFVDAAGSAINTNPVILDAGGRAPIFGDGSYRQVVQDRNGALVWDLETGVPVLGIEGASLTISGAASIGGALTVGGATTLNGSLNVLGPITADTLTLRSLNVQTINGNPPAVGRGGRGVPAPQYTGAAISLMGDIWASDSLVIGNPVPPSGGMQVGDLNVKRLFINGVLITDIGPPVVAIWDGGATTWDGGSTTWDG
jgi:hypothetical protein